MSYSYYRSLTIDHTKVASTQANFPVLVSLTSASLKTVSNGGQVQNTSGFDIGFFTSSALTSALFWEIESYDPVNGVLVAWVKVPSVSSSVDTVIYLAYGNAAISTFQSTATSVWDADYVAVWHMGTSGLLSDSTGGHDLISDPTHYTAGTGQIDGGLNTTLGTSTSPFTMGTTLTVECWENTASPSSPEMFVEKSPVNAAWELFHNGSGVGALTLRGGGAGDVTAPFPASGWHYLAATITGTSGAIYVDDNPAVTGAVAAAGDTSSAVNVGNYDGTGFFLSGSLDEVRISKIVRSADWIAAGYANQSDPGTFLTLGSETPASSAGGALIGGALLAGGRGLVGAR